MVLPWRHRWESKKTVREPVFRRKSLPPIKKRCRPRVEILEDRTAPAVFNVTTFLDSVALDSTGIDALGQVSLRSAIMAANEIPGPDQIILPSGSSAQEIYALSLGSSDEDFAAEGDLDIRDDLTIVGSDTENTIISGGELDRVFDIFPGVTVNITGVTIQDGAATSFGGGIANEGILSLIESVISTNAVFGEWGSGEEGDGFSALGGGIYNSGSLTILRSTLTNNYANGGQITDMGTGGFAAGGGIYNHFGTVVIQESTFSYNLAEGGYGDSGRGGEQGEYGYEEGFFSSGPGDGGIAAGGAIFSQDGSLNIVNTTISTNTVFGGSVGSFNEFGEGAGGESFGGGVATESGNAFLLNNTIVNNQALGGFGDGEDPIDGEGIGGGFFNLEAEVEIANTIISQNFVDIGNDLEGIITDLGNNLISTPPSIGPLQDNGGPTETHALLASSPAIDAGNDALAPLTDQRNVSRAGTSDIGAFEVNQNSLVVTNTNDSGPGSLRQAILDGNALGGGTITFQIGNPGSSQTIQPTTIANGVSLPRITAPLVIDGWSQGGAGYNGAPLITIDGTLAEDLGLGANAFRLDGDGAVLQGLAITNFSAAGPNGFAVLITGSNNRVQGNYLGLNAQGETENGNARGGVWITEDAFGNLIGTDADGENDEQERNVISGNRGFGLLINGSYNTVSGNYIGVGVDGESNVSNQDSGILISGSFNLIGGTTVTETNVIAFNGAEATGVRLDAGTGNAIRRNSFFENAGLGIDHLPFRPNANDPSDADAGANNLQNHPEIQSAFVEDGLLNVTYQVPSSPDHSAYPLTIEFFIADIDGHEGQTYIGSVTYTVEDSQNLVTAQFAPEVEVRAETSIVATATDANGNTSEFSPNFAFNTPPEILTLEISGDGEINEGESVTLSGSFSPVFEEDQFRVAIDWGDDSPDTILEVGSATSFETDHTYDDGLADPNRLIQVTILNLRSGAQAQDSLEILVNNVAPTADPGGPYRFREGSDLTTLNGNGDDPSQADREDLLLEWDVNGDGIFGDVVGPNPSLPWNDLQALGLDNDGTFSIALRVTDKDGATSAPSETELIIDNLPPQIDAGGPYTIREGDSLFLNGSAFDVSDADNGNLEFAWDLDGDGDFLDAFGSTPTLTWQQLQDLGIDNDGEFFIRLQVSDDDSRPFVVERLQVDNTPPQADAGGPYTITEGEFLTLEGTATDVSAADQEALTFAWDLNGDGDFGDALGANPTISWDELQALGLDDAELTITLRVSDDDDSGFSNANLTINNAAPIADAGGPYTIREGEQLSLNGSATDPNENDILIFEWDLNNDGDFTDAEGENPTISWNDLQELGLDNDGGFQAALKVSDGDTDDTDDAELTIENTPPEVDAGGPYVIREGDSLALNGTAGDESDADEANLQFEWTVTTGEVEIQIADIANPTFSWDNLQALGVADDGDFELTLTVSDDDSSVARVADLSILNVDPAINQFNVPAVADQGDTVNLTAGATDPAGTNDPLTFTWTVTAPDGFEQEFVGANVLVNLPDAGIYQVQLRVTDDDGGEAFQNAQIEVNGTVVEPPPVPNVEPPNVAPSLAVPARIVVGIDNNDLTNAVITDPDSNSFTINADFGDGISGNIVSGTTLGNILISHDYMAEGDYNLTLTVSDEDGGARQYTVEVSVLPAGIEEFAEATTVNGVAEASVDGLTGRLEKANPNETGRILVARLDSEDVEQLQGEGGVFVVEAATGAGGINEVITAFDVRGFEVGAGDTIIISFEIELENGAVPFLRFIDPETGEVKLVQGSSNTPVSLTSRGDFLIVEPIPGTNRVRITVILDGTSFPSVSDLRGTVFSFSSQNGQTLTTVPNLNNLLAQANGESTAASAGDIPSAGIPTTEFAGGLALQRAVASSESISASPSGNFDADLERSQEVDEVLQWLMDIHLSAWLAELEANQNPPQPEANPDPNDQTSIEPLNQLFRDLENSAGEVELGELLRAVGEQIDGTSSAIEPPLAPPNPPAREVSREEESNTSKFALPAALLALGAFAGTVMTTKSSSTRNRSSLKIETKEDYF